MFLSVKWKMLIITFVFIMGISCSNVHASEQVPSRVLLLYDSLAKGTSKEGNIESMQRLLSSYGIQVTQSTFDTYKQNSLSQYSKVIGIRNLDELTVSNKDFLNDFETYEGDYLHIGTSVPNKVEDELDIQTARASDLYIKLSIDQFSESRIHMLNVPYILQAEGMAYGRITSDHGDVHAPYGVRGERYAYIPYYEQGNLSEIAISYIIRDWLDTTKQGQTYLIFKEIYPFSDLKLLETMADKLYGAGIPFMVSTRPVFSNTDYPAMLRYMETLKYVQSRNGSIIVNTPVVSSTMSDNGPVLQAQMESYVDVLADYGVVPLGIGAEMYWSYDQQYAEYGMGLFDSSVLFPNENVIYRSQSNSSQSFRSSLYSVSLAFLKQLDHSDKILPDLPMDSVITYDFPGNEEQQNQVVQELIDSWITFSDYKYGNHNVITEKNSLSSNSGFLTVNGHRVDLNDAYNNIDSDYAYTVKEEQSFTKLFNIQNKIFIVLIVITLIMFGGLFIIGYRLYLRKYINQRRDL